MLQWLTILWLPILASTIGIFVASSILHMVFKWHMSDYKKFANEDDVRTAVRAGNTEGGMYVVPSCDPKDFNTPEMKKKMQEGPIGILLMRRPGVVPGMATPLIQWFVFVLATSALIAYIAYKAILTPDTFGQVARLTGGLAFIAYASGSVQFGIWYGKPWNTVAKDIFDAVIYATITGIAFGMLWKPEPY
jgi:predicted transcriptional regulator